MASEDSVVEGTATATPRVPTTPPTAEASVSLSSRILSAHTDSPSDRHNVNKETPSSSPSSVAVPVGPHNFEKLRVLGVGSVGRVYLVQSVGLEKTGLYAMKVLRKSELAQKNREQRVLTEKQILSAARHPLVVSLHFSFQTPEYHYLVMQYCAGGAFFSLLKRQQQQRLPEAHARFYAAEVLLALEYLHLLGVIYRDLKPENILVHESGHLLLSDFDLAHQVTPPKPIQVALDSRPAPLASGTTTSRSNPLWFRMADRRRSLVRAYAASSSSSASVAASHVVRRRSCFACLCGAPARYPMMDTESHLGHGEKRRSFVGTTEYVAPEIIAEDGYTGSVDWWALGILLYEMLYGKTPFRGKSQAQTLENVLDLTEAVDFPTDDASAPAVSDECKDLLRKLLAKDVAQRLQNPLSIKAHPFFRSVEWPLIRHQQPPIVPALADSLKAKEYPGEQSHVFDDEVPYAKGVLSPRMARQQANKNRVASPSSSSPPSSQELRESAAATAVNACPLSPVDPMDELRTSTAPHAHARSLLASSASPAGRPAPQISSDLQSPAAGSPNPSQMTLGSASASPQTGTIAEDIALAPFDYAAGYSTPFSTTSGSSQSLSASLSDLLGNGIERC